MFVLIELLGNKTGQAEEGQGLVSRAGLGQIMVRDWAKTCVAESMLAGRSWDKSGAELEGQGQGSAWHDKMEHWLVSKGLNLF